MINISIHDKERVLSAIKNGKIDSADVCFPNLIDSIILKMMKIGVLGLLGNALKDKRDNNKSIPLHLLVTLAITAKMKIMTSLTDIPYAITDEGTLAELGYNLIDSERDLEKGLFSEGAVRDFVGRYEGNEFIEFYNKYVQGHVLPHMEAIPYIHILDCTKLEVNLENKNYEKSEVTKDEDGMKRGYKLGTIRGLYGDTGVIEEIVFGSIKPHDIELCRDMLTNTKVLKKGDILINDRGFISREMLNHLKSQKGVDSYIPLKKSMEAYEVAVTAAVKENKWQKHPNAKREHQEIAYVSDLGPHWISDKPEEDVPISGCVVRDTSDPQKTEYFVFVTTDTGKTAKQIIKTYELRPEIEEDYRQIKDFWNIEDFKSTKYTFIQFHVVLVLLGYMYFQIYKNLDENEKMLRKSLPILMKKHVAKKTPKTIVVYAGEFFGIFAFLEFIQLYASCSADVRKRLDKIFSLI